jgi:hypothetical protein
MESSWNQEGRPSLGRWRMAIGLGTALLVATGGALAATNPEQPAYEHYATQQLSAYLMDDICANAPNVSDLRQHCRSLIQDNQPQISQFVAQNTHRQNFVFFSLYTTDLSVGSFMPDYQVATIGIFQRFYIVEPTVFSFI